MKNHSGSQSIVAEMSQHSDCYWTRLVLSVYSVFTTRAN